MSAATNTNVPDTGDNTGLRHAMSKRQLVMMSLGSAIGAGLFIGSGQGILEAGPAVLLSYFIAGTLVIIMMWALGEMAAAQPSSGAFSVYAEKAMGPVAGATLGWLWWIQLVVVIAAEALASSSILIEILPDQFAAFGWAFSLFFLLVFTGVNLLGVKNFGEFEFWFALLKIIAIIILIAIGLTILFGPMYSGYETGPSMIANNGGFFPRASKG